MVTLSKEDLFKGSTNINVLGACATLASKRLLDHLIQFIEKSRSGKIPFKRHNGTVKCGINEYQTLMFLMFFIFKNLLLYIRIKSYNLQCRCMSTTSNLTSIH